MKNPEQKKELPVKMATETGVKPQDPMRILLITHGNLERQGINSFMLEWIKALKAIDFNYETTIYFRGEMKDQCLADTYRYYGAELCFGCLPENTTTTNPVYRKKIQNDLCNILREKKYDIVHINTSIKGFTILALQEALRAGVPIRISHSHGRILDSMGKRIYHPLLQRYIRRTATAYAGCSAYAGLYMFGKAGVNSAKWHFIPNAIDTEKFSFDESSRNRCRKKLNLDSDKILIGAVGALNEVKNHIFLLNVMQKLRQAGKKAMLILFGDGDMLPVLNEKASAMGLSDCVVFYGATSDIPSWLSALDCYVMPSLSEGLPIAAVEAQANGLPCLLSNHVPHELDLCTDVYHLPIDAGPEPWVQIVLNLPGKSSQEREQGAENVRKAGFGKESMPEYVRLLYGIK